MLIRRRGGGWGIPKGGVEKRLSQKANALKELYEEAGVLATFMKGSTRYRARREDGVQDIKVFVVRLEVLLRKYPERVGRQRKLFTPEKAAKHLPRSVTKLMKRVFKKTQAKGTK